MQHVAIRLAQRMRSTRSRTKRPLTNSVLAAALRRVGRAHGESRERDAGASASTVRGVRNEVVAEQLLDARAAAGGDRRCTTRPLCCSVKPTSGCASATRRNASSQCAHSVASVRRNLRRAGVLKNSSSTVTLVPIASAAGAIGLTRAAVDFDAPRVRLLRGARRQREARHRRRSTPAPRRGTRARRSPRGRAPNAIFDVACRATASANSSRSMPLAVVGDPDALDAAGGELDVDLRGTGVERVLQQFLQRRCRALDDFACRDLVDEQVRQRADRHAISAAGLAPSARRRRRQPD